MKKPAAWSNAILLAIISVAVAHAQAQRGPAVPQMRGDGPPPEAKPFSITRTDPALDDIVSPGAKLVELGRGFGLTEGGLWIAEGASGYWIFAGLLDNVLYKVTPQKQVSVFMERAGYTGNDPDHVGAQTRSGRSHVLLIGPSCTGMDHQGRVIWCADNDRQVMRLEKDGTHTVLSGGMDGRQVQRPERHRDRGGRCGLCNGQRFRPARRRQESRQTAAERHLPDQEWQDDARAERCGSRWHAERHRAVA